MRPRVRHCDGCGTDVDVPIYFLCDPCLSDRVAAERTAQGLPPAIEDQATLERLAVLFRLPDPRREARHGNGAGAGAPRRL